MNYLKKTQSQMADQYEKLRNISKNCIDKEWGKNDDSLCMKFSLSSPEGRKFYKSLSDELLLNILKEIAYELGYPPSQREVFWVWRDYINNRFKKWPYALAAAELPKSSGSGGISLERANEVKERKEQIIKIVRESAKSLGRLPHPRDLPDTYWELNNCMYKWNEIIQAANLDQDFFLQNSLNKIIDLEDEYCQLLGAVLSLANTLGRTPLRSEVNSNIKEKLVNRCGSWRNVLFQIGLEPIKRIKPFSSTYVDHRCSEKKRYHKNSLYDCYYKVLNLDNQSVNDLMLIKELQVKLGRPPEKNEVPKEIRLRLQEKCGSWANTLFQIQYIKEYEE